MLKRVLLACALLGALLAPALTAPASADPVDPVETSGTPRGSLHILTFDVPGTAGYHGRLKEADYRAALLDDQDQLLSRLGVAEPVYRWTTALSGVAVELNSYGLLRARLTPGINIERNSMRSLAGASVTASAAHLGAAPDEDAETDGPTGQGTVIGFVDTGIIPDLPVFAAHSSLGEEPEEFTGSCEPTDGWQESDCNGKIVSASWFVDGFGADNLRSGAQVSPRDDHGHGTQVASVAAGDADVSALADGENLGTFSGIAPDARIAVYKACWTAPDPTDDGCATADVVSAIDQAVIDGVDVLNLSVSGGEGLDAVDRALLGATEADIVVATAAGNDVETTGNEQPWTLTVGATTGRDIGGELELPDGTRISGVLTSSSVPDPSPIVLARDIPAPGSTSEQARLCTPGALDAAKAGDHIVVCERGTVARVSKSSAVDLADGVAMILVNGPDEDLGADFHSVPTLHISADEGDVLLDALATDDELVGTLERAPGTLPTPEVLISSAGGHDQGTVLKPDLVAHGFGVLAASAPRSGRTWQLLTGTSAASARTSALAALVRSQHPDWSADRVRSALMTTTEPAAGNPGARREGSGVAIADPTAPGLVLDLDPTSFRTALTDAGPDGVVDHSALNLPSVQVPSPDSDETVVVRTVTNAGPTDMYYSSSATGFEHHQVTVTPAALRIAPGESREIQVRIPAHAEGPAADSGVVVWLGADDTTVRIPVSLTD